VRGHDGGRAPCLRAVFKFSNLYRGIVVKLLHIDAIILGNRSVSREVTAAIVDKLRKANPHVEVIDRDLAITPSVHMTLASLPGNHPSSALAGPLDHVAIARDGLYGSGTTAIATEHAETYMRTVLSFIVFAMRRRSNPRHTKQQPT